MLYRMYMDKVFREDSDLMGFIQAPTIGVALDILETTVRSTWPHTQPPVFAKSTANSDYGQLESQSTDEDGNSGTDIYMIESCRSDIALFYGEYSEQINMEGPM